MEKKNTYFVDINTTEDTPEQSFTKILWAINKDKF